MVGGGAVLAGTILDNVTAFTETPATAEYVATWSMLTIGALLLLVGAAALYTRYGDIYGRLGLAGTVIAGLGFLSMTVGGLWSTLYTGPAGEATQSGGLVFFGLLVAVLGSLVFAIALRRAGLAGRAAALLIVAPVVLVATFVVGETLTALSGFDVMWLLFLVTFCTGWVALGDAIRYTSDSALEETATPAA